MPVNYIGHVRVIWDPAIIHLNNQLRVGLRTAAFMVLGDASGADERLANGGPPPNRLFIVAVVAAETIRQAAKAAAFTTYGYVRPISPPTEPPWSPPTSPISPPSIARPLPPRSPSTPAIPG